MDILVLFLIIMELLHVSPTKDLKLRISIRPSIYPPISISPLFFKIKIFVYLNFFYPQERYWILPTAFWHLWIYDSFVNVVGCINRLPNVELILNCLISHLVIFLQYGILFTKIFNIFVLIFLSDIGLWFSCCHQV